MIFRILFYSITIFLIFEVIPFADVKSENGTINFDHDSNGNPEMTLNSNGLGIGLEPSANLHINGNAIITQSITVGSSEFSSNLSISGSLGQSYGNATTNTILNDHSVYLADTSLGNVICYLPAADTVQGRIINFKKTSLSNSAWVSGNGFLIDESQQIVLNSGLNGAASFVSNGSQWYLMDSLNIDTAPSSSNLVLWLPFDEGNGDTINDKSSNGINITRANFETSGNGWVEGVSGNALMYDGVNDEVTVPNNSEFYISEGTLSFWMYIVTSGSAAGSNHGVFTFRGDNSMGEPFNIFYAQLRTDDHLRVFVTDSASAVNAISSDDTLPVLTWMHIAVVISSGQYNVYIDGEKQSTTQSLGTGQMYVGSDELRVGYLSSPYFNGRLDDFRIYNVALTQEEVQFLSASGKR